MTFFNIKPTTLKTFKMLVKVTMKQSKVKYLFIYFLAYKIWIMPIIIMSGITLHLQYAQVVSISGASFLNQRIKNKSELVLNQTKSCQVLFTRNQT